MPQGTLALDKPEVLLQPEKVPVNRVPSEVRHEAAAPAFAFSNALQQLKVNLTVRLKGRL